MRFDTILVLFLTSLVIMAGAHHLAITFYLYYVYLWFDIPMHFLGGVTVGLGFHTDLFRRYSPFFLSLGLTGTVAGVLVVGLIWEVFEWYTGLVDSVRYAEDTALDLVMDTLGGALGYGLVHMMRRHEY